LALCILVVLRYLVSAEAWYNWHLRNINIYIIKKGVALLGI
jgi:hypothetical protein